MRNRLPALLVHLYPVLILLVIAAPVLNSAALSLPVYGRWPWEYIPQFSDEVYYWHQAASVIAAGTESGYYSVTEAPAPIGPFYAWGAFVPLLYGTIGAVFGWGLHSITIINLIAIVLAAAALIGLAGAYRQPRPGLLLLLLIVLLTFNPLRLYGSTAMLETLMYACALVMAGIFDRLLRHANGEKRLSPGAIAAILAFITAVALLRATWALLLIPAVLLANRRPHPLAIMGWLALAAGLGLAAVLVTRATSAFYPYPFTDALALLRTDLRGGLGRLWQIFQNNLNNLALGALIVHIQQTQIFTLLVGTLAFAGVGHVRRWLRPRLKRELAVYFWVLAAPFAFNVIVYDATGLNDFRQLAPFLLLTLALLALHRRAWVVIPLAVTMLIGLDDVQVQHAALYEAGFNATTNAAYEQQREAYAPVIAFDPAADPWCSTLNFHLDYFWELGYLLLAVPPGIGLTWTSEYAPLTEPGLPPLRSRWFIVQDANAALIERTTPLERLLPLPVGGLYRNLAAEC